MGLPASTAISGYRLNGTMVIPKTTLRHRVMSDTALFRENGNTDFFERLLSQLTGQDKNALIGELEQQTLDAVSDLPDTLSTSDIYQDKLCAALLVELQTLLGIDATAIDFTMNKSSSFFKVNKRDIYNEVVWAKFLDTHSNHTKLAGVIGKIAALDTPSKSDNPLFDDIKSLTTREVVAKYALSDEALDSLGFTIPVACMPASMKAAISAAHAVKAYVEDNLSADYEGCQVYVESTAIAIHVVLRGECGSNPVASIADVLKLTA